MTERENEVKRPNWSGEHHSVPRTIDEIARVRSLHALNVLEAPPNEYFDRITSQAAFQLQVPITQINFIDTDLQWTKSSAGPPLSNSIARDISFCAYTILDADKATIVPDATLDARFKANPLVTGDPGIRFYAGIPLLDRQRRAVGVICIIDLHPRELDNQHLETLQFFADVVSASLEAHRLSRELNNSEHHRQSLIELNPQMPWIASPKGGILQGHTRWLTLAGVSLNELQDGSWLGAINPTDRDRLVKAWTVSLTTGRPFDQEYRLKLASGHERWFRSRALGGRDKLGKIIAWYGTNEDVHDSKLAEEALRDTEQRLRFALEVGKLGAWQFNFASQLVVASDVCAQHFGFMRGDELSDYSVVLEKIQADDRQKLDDFRSRVLAGGSEEVELRTCLPNGRCGWVWISGRMMAGRDASSMQAFGLTSDISLRKQETARREQLEGQLYQLSHHDALTGLGNRRLLDAELPGMIAVATQDRKIALVVICINNLKLINEELGRELGDYLLKQFADGLRSCVIGSDLVFRTSDEKFVVIRTKVVDAVGIDAFAHRILTLLAVPVQLGNRLITVELRAGVSLAPDDASTPDQLWRNANTALRRSKTSEGSRLCFFQPDTDFRHQDREALKLDLADAITNNELRLYYQPYIDIKSHRVAGFEALMRWQHSNRGLLAPDEFIPLAEEVGRIGSFGKWALRTACQEATRWPRHVHVAVNLSVMQFAENEIINDVMNALAESGLSPDRLELEVTETVLLCESESFTDTLRSLRDMGVLVSLDDFGTGYSSLSYLRSFRFDKIKIDKSLMLGLPDSAGGDAIVRAILALGRSLDTPVVAEGVEHNAQLEFLSMEGCAQAQGYLFTRPVAAESALMIAHQIAVPVWDANDYGRASKP